MKFEVSVEQMAEMTAAVVERDRMRGQLRSTEAKIVRMRKQLTSYQAICERAKKAADGAAAAELPDVSNELKSKRLQLLIKPSLVDWLRRRAVAMGISVNELVNRIVEEAARKEVAE